MNMRWIGITFIGICIIVGLIAGLFSHSIEAALTLPLSVRTSQVTATPTKTAPVMPAGTARPSMPSTPTAGGVTILAQDAFKRANQVFWERPLMGGNGLAMPIALRSFLLPEAQAR